ncbi:MAG TPA: PBP1A family penicillin-binding protein [Candidatus Saccharimonadales bacterium]|nr:PBP1A family penicillin-binding protein [Candidatus Saccharimonadales bacterium]
MGFVCFFLHNHTVDFSALQQDMAGKPSILLDQHGQQWGRFQSDKRKYVLLESMPQHLIQAFLVTEDRNFFQHPGISFRGILRSILVNLYKRKKVQGASTITQQLVKLLFFHSDKTFSRKIKEQLYAILVERQWSKEQILEAYLNNVYFGYGIYGVQAAAQRFWGKDIGDITIDQAATLASIMRSPQFYSPIHAPQAVFKRRNMILSMMHDFKMITVQQYQQAIVQDLNIHDPENNDIAPHLKETIRIFLENLVGKEKLYSGGLTIQTTLDIDMQKSCQKAFINHIACLRQSLHPEVDGGLVSIDSATGEIRAMIGGFDFAQSKFNRAMQARRQMGSVFKVFVYAAALEKGLHFSDVEIDESIELMQGTTAWRPENHDKKFRGPMTRAYALSHSNNTVTVKTLLQTGVSNVIDVAKRCHITAPMPPYPSLALGCVDVTVMEVVGSFNVMANHGKYVQPHFLRWVKNNMGKKIYKSTVVKEQVIDSKIASQIARVLTFGIQRLKKIMGVQWFGGQALGKSGTINDSRTSWFCGATPELTTAIYIGCDRNHSLGQNMYGSKTAFPIWFRFHAGIAKNQDDQMKIEKKKTEFYYDPGLHEVSINWKTGEQMTDINNPDVVSLLE